MAEKVIPGQSLGSTLEYTSGNGTYARDGHVYAAIIGKTKVMVKDKRPMIEVVRDKEATAVPEIQAIVTGRIIRINPRFATMKVMVVGTTPTTEDFQGIIRLQDVRATEKDKVRIDRAFRPGDIVRARVISLGDARSYYLSTAENSLGAVFATSMAGEFVCIASGSFQSLTEKNLTKVQQ
ncbi:Exosome complex component CSL4 [Gonapodya sp. JEL0774]|nr:Exosome complex component CSL4 [Gonapodya sp. JEL0774]